jgi:hypothetical protein
LSQPFFLYTFGFVEANKINRFWSSVRSFLVKNDKKVGIYLICVFISTAFWFLNALNKNYSIDLAFPVEYINLPTNKALVNDPPDKFLLHVNAHGFTLLRYKLSAAFAPLVFDVNEYTDNLMQKTERSEFAIPTRQFVGRLAQQLGDEIEVVMVSPDTLKFKFDQMVSRSIRVKPDVKITLKQQYLISGSIQTKPEYVKVFGPLTILDTLRFVQTQPRQYEMASSQINEKIAIQPIGRLRFEPSEVEMTIPVEEFTESHLTVPVYLKDCPDSLLVKLFPGAVDLTFTVGLSHFSEVGPQDFKLVVDCNEIKEHKTRLRVSVESAPTLVGSLKISPEELEYLIEKK